MQISRIHHYTILDALALILSSKKIRFNRSDKVDDITESQRHPQIRFGSYFFISCWTDDQEESIPQWHMYTEGMKGVRISLPAMPFQQKRLIPRPGWAVQTKGEMFAPIAMDEMFGVNYFIVPMHLNAEQFGGPVEYCHDVESRYEKAISLTEENGVISVNIKKPFDLVRLKKREWTFQKEYRFALFILPSIPVPPEGPGSPDFVKSFPNFVATALRTGMAPGIDWFDVDLSDDAIKQMEVTLGPRCSEGSKLAVRSLVDVYAPGCRIRESCFTGSIRGK